jgi:hypothetical protein
VFNDSLNEAFFVPMLNTVPGNGCAKALAVSEQVNGLEKVGLSLTVPPGKKTDLRGRKYFQILDVSVMEKTQSCDLHA